MISTSVRYHLAMAIGPETSSERCAVHFLQAIVAHGLADEAHFWMIKKQTNIGPATPIEKFILLAQFPKKSIDNETVNCVGLVDSLQSTGFLVAPDLKQWPRKKAIASQLQILLSVDKHCFIELISSNNKSENAFASFDAHDYQQLQPIFSKLRKQLNEIEKIAEQRSHEDNLKPLLLRETFQHKILATLSHELRNPLNIILGYLDMLSESKLSNEQQGHLEIVYDTATSLYYTIKRVFQFTGHALHQHSLNSNSFHPLALLKNLEQVMQHLAIKKRLKLNFRIDESLSQWLLGDVSKLNDIFVYLIDNAIKFTSTGEIEVIAKSITETTDFVVIQFEVNDTGKGIQQDQIEHITDFFQQEDAGITRQYGGLGLGLSIAKVFVEEMGGSLTLRSRKTGGTTIVFNLPFQKDWQHSSNAVQLQFTVNEALTKTIKVLLVDDDIYQREMGGKILKNWDIHFAENGLDAIRFLKENPDTQVVLMDIRMPQLDGIGAVEIIRNELKSKALIVAVSGEVQETTITECIDAGMDAFVPKPYDKKLLIQTVIEKLNRPELLLQEVSSVNLFPLAGMKALVVEDDKMLQLLSSRYLKDAQCQFDLAPDGTTALAFFDSNTYDFVLLDIYLPDMTGFDIAMAMRGKSQESCIIAYSGDDTSQTKMACMAAGMDGVILKSYQKSEELANSIHQIIEGKRMENRALAQEEPQLYNLSLLKDTLGDSPDDLRDILLSFITYSEQMLKTLTAAQIANERETLRKTAHSMKSAAAQFEMKKATVMLQQLEAESNTMSDMQIKNLVGNVKVLFAKTLVQIKNESYLIE